MDGSPDGPHARATIVPGLLAALAWGIAAPGVKWAFDGEPALRSSAWMYAAAGIALGVVLFVRPRGAAGERLRRRDAPWLLATIALGGVLGPWTLVTGMKASPAHVGSLLLNLEIVFTVAFAVLLFRERATARRVAGAALVAVGGFAVAWETSPEASPSPDGALWIAAACLAWALDTNVTRQIAGRDAVLVSAWKTLAGGAVLFGLSVAAEGFAPPADAPRFWAGGAAVGIVGVGASLVLYVLSLRRIGTTRSAVLFGTAPFVGAAVALAVFGGTVSVLLAVSAAAMAAGVSLVASERAAAGSQAGTGT